MSMLCVCDTCLERPTELTCYCEGMCAMRDSNVNCIRRHRLWPRTFTTANLINALEHCPMSERVSENSTRTARGHYMYPRKAIQTQSLVHERDYHFLFEMGMRFGLGRDTDNVRIVGFVQLSGTEEVRKRCRYVGSNEYLQVLDEDKLTFCHDLMTLIDEHIFLGSRHIAIQHFDLTNNDWYDKGESKLVENTILKFTAFLRLDCAPECETPYGYCPACVDDRCLHTNSPIAVDADTSPLYTAFALPQIGDIDGTTKEIQPTLELADVETGDIPPVGQVIQLADPIVSCTPRRPCTLKDPICPDAPRRGRRTRLSYFTAT